MTEKQKRADVNAKVEAVASLMRSFCPRMAIRDLEEVKNAVRGQWIEHYKLDPLGRKKFDK